MSANHSTLRYTGPRPFTERERDRFFGRDEDIEALARTIRLNRLTVLTGKSGMGKSSLLQAGVVPALAEEKFRTLFIRFGAWQPGQISPLQRVIDQLSALPESRNAILDAVSAKAKPSFWQLCKAIASRSTRLLLVFDQFEELFLYPADQVKAFGEAFAHGVLGEIPESFNEHFRELRRHKKLSPEDIAFIQAEIPLHIVFSIRSDRMDKLQYLVDYVPTILRNCYNLGPLSEFGARAAIIKTARAEGDFLSPAFRYAPEALDRIIGELTRPDERGQLREIQSFLLQIICQYAEERIVIGKKVALVQADDLGDIASIIGAFYEFQINKISADATQQTYARDFVEDGLIFEGVRMILNEEIILKKFLLTNATLTALENTHLIRGENADGGRRTYELSHDALVAPIARIREVRTIAAERLRLEAETAEAMKKAQAEIRRVKELEDLKNKAEVSSKKAKTFSVIAIGIAALAVAAAGWAVVAEKQAEANECTANAALRDFWEGEIATSKENLKTYQDANATVTVGILQRKIDSLTQKVNTLHRCE